MFTRSKATARARRAFNRNMLSVDAKGLRRANAKRSRSPSPEITHEEFCRLCDQRRQEAFEERYFFLKDGMKPGDYTLPSPSPSPVSSRDGSQNPRGSQDPEKTAVPETPRSTSPWIAVRPYQASPVKEGSPSSSSEEDFDLPPLTEREHELDTVACQTIVKGLGHTSPILSDPKWI